VLEGRQHVALDLDVLALAVPGLEEEPELLPVLPLVPPLTMVCISSEIPHKPSAKAHSISAFNSVDSTSAGRPGVGQATCGQKYANLYWGKPPVDGTGPAAHADVAPPVLLEVLERLLSFLLDLGVEFPTEKGMAVQRNRGTMSSERKGAP